MSRPAQGSTERGFVFRNVLRNPAVPSGQSNAAARHANLPVMASDNPSPNETERRVLRFRRGGQHGASGPVSSPPPVEDLGKYERTGDTDDYRHRMITNVAAFVFIIGLIWAGVWLANTMAQMRKNQDCVLSGRRGCTPVDVHKNSW